MKGKYFFAILLILFGISLILDQFRIWTFGSLIGTWWPLVIIAWGLSIIAMNRHNLWSGSIVLLIGVLFQADSLDMLPGSAWDFFWPITLILLGLYLLTNRKHHITRDFKNRSETSDNFIKYDTFFSGVKEKIEIQGFQGGSIQVAFGGVELDLTKSTLDDDGAILDINASFGGVQIYLPREWKLDIQGTPFAGALNNKTRPYDDMTNAKTLKIRYSVMFGGIDIKN